MNEVVDELEKLLPDGLQIVWCAGILRSTKAIYKQKGLYFVFDVNEKWNFSTKNGYTLNELLEHFQDTWWLIDYPIS